MKFTSDTTGFCCNSCGTSYVCKGSKESRNPGVLVSFEKPFEPVDGEESVTIETSHGPVYIRLATTYTDKEHFENVLSDYVYSRYPGGKTEYNQYNHLSIREVWTRLYVSGKTEEGFRLPTESGVYILVQSIDRAQITSNRIVADLGDTLLYRSPPFFNRYHWERNHPSLEFFVFEIKEPKNEV